MRVPNRGLVNIKIIEINKTDNKKFKFISTVPYYDCLEKKDASKSIESGKGNYQLNPNYIIGFVDGFYKKEIKLFSTNQQSCTNNHLSLVPLSHQCYKYEFIMRTREPGSDIKRGPGGGPSRGGTYGEQIYLL